MKNRQNNDISLRSSLDRYVKLPLVGLTVGLAVTVASHLFAPNTAYAQEGPSAAKKEDLISRIIKYTNNIETYYKNNQTEKAKTEKANLEKDLIKSESGLEESIKVLNKVDALISDKTFVKYLMNLKVSLPEEKEDKVNYLFRLESSLGAFISTREKLSPEENLIDLKLGRLFLYNTLTKFSPKKYSPDKEKIENELRDRYASSDDIDKKAMRGLLQLYDLNFDFKKPKKATPVPEKPAPKEVTPVPEKPKPVPKEVIPAPEKPVPPPKEVKPAPEKPFAPPQPSLEDEVLSLENQAVAKYMESLSEKDSLKRIRIQEEALKKYLVAEAKDPSTIGYATDIQDLKKQIQKGYEEWLMQEKDPKTYETGLAQAERSLGVHKARELKKQLRFSNERKKSGTKVIESQASLETTGGRNVDSTVAHQRSRLSFNMLRQAVQQHREERIMNRQGEVEVAQEDVGHVDIDISKLRLRAIGAGGRDTTTRKTQDFDDPASLTHAINSTTRYKITQTEDFGGILAQINLKGLTPISLVGGAGYEMTDTATTVKTVNEIIDLNNPNGSYPEEILTKLESSFREGMVLIGGEKILKNGKAGARIGHKRITERQGLGDQRTVRNTDITWAELRAHLMLNKYFGFSGIVLRESVRDELLKPGITERSRESDKFSQVRGGGAVAATIPGSGITAFARYAHTGICDKGAAGILITTSRHDGTAASVLEMLTLETELDLGILPGQTGKVKDLLDSVNLSLLSSMTQTGNRSGFGLVARADVWNVPGYVPAWIATAAATIDTPDGSITGRYSLHNLPEGKIMELRLGCLSPSRTYQLELIIREFQNKRSKDPLLEMGVGFSWSFQ